LGTIDANLEFHEWMERHRTGANVADGMDDELDLEELIALGKEAGITHPYACLGSPFFNNFTKEQILEVVHPSPDQRPFSSLNDLALVVVNDSETKFAN
jgi:hypothetical protein